MNFIESCCRKKLILFNLEKFQNSPSIVLDDAEWEIFFYFLMHYCFIYGNDSNIQEKKMVL